MSHFSKISVKFKDQACLVEALQRFGFYPQIHDQPVNLSGYRGDTREQTAHIVVPRNQISFSSNDLGFYWNGNEYECFISDYDKSYGQAKKGFGLGSQFLPLLQQEYINLYLPKLASLLGGEVVETKTYDSITTVRVLLPTQTIRR
jgi:Protein of unknown function (DUF1257)